MRIKTGDSVIIKIRQSNGGVKEIHGEVVGVGKYYSRFLGDKEPQYSVRTNEKSSYLGLHYVVDADEIKLSKEPFIYDTAAEDEFQKNNPSMCHILGVVTKYNTHLFLNTD